MASRPRLLSSLAPPAALALVSAAAGLSLARVFSSGDFVVAVLGAAVLPHVIGVVVRARRGTLPIGVAATLLGLLAYVPWALELPTTRLGLPTADTVDAVSRHLEHGWHVLRTVEAPAPVSDGALLLAVLVVWTMASLADLLAFRRDSTLGALAPGLVFFVWTSTLGTSDWLLACTAAFVAASLVFLVVQHQAVLHHTRSWLVAGGTAGTRRLAPTLGIAAVALMVGVLIAPALPGADADPILDVANRSGSAASRSYRTSIAPLVDIGAKLSDTADQQLFTVEAGSAEYWRITALDEYSSVGGGQWTLSASGSDAVSEGLHADVPPGALHQTFRIGPLGERWVPAAFEPVRTSLDDVLVVESSKTLVTRADSVSGLHYTIDSSLQPTESAITTAQQAATARSVPPALEQFVELPADVPTSIHELATRVVEAAGATTPYAQAAALRNYFRSDAFVYDPTVDLHDDIGAVEEFLRTGHGFCVQFAGTYALMARSLGIPTRVAVGFTPGKLVDGRYAVSSHDAHAWPEVWLAGLGWTHLFDPTPPARGATAGGSDLPGEPVVPAPPAVVETPSGTAAPTSPQPTPAAPGSAAPATPTSLPSTETPSVTLGDNGVSPWVTVLVALIVLVGLALVAGATILVAKGRRRARRRDTPDPGEAVQGAWDEALDLLREARSPVDPSATPLELAARAAPGTTEALGRVAGIFTSARYGIDAVEPADATTAWTSVTDLEHALDASSTRRARWRRRLDPSTLRRSGSRRDAVVR